MTAPLESQATEFAESLTRTVQAIAPDSASFMLRLTETKSGTTLFSVLQPIGQSILLNVKSEPLLRLEVTYDCGLDSVGKWMAVDGSKVAVYPGAEDAREPLFRYEYVRRATSVPAAHIQFHFDREFLADVFDNAGRNTRRARRRKKPKAQVSDVHFPVGGHRFRPCLEDVLEMLIDEFGLDHPPNALATLADGRETWRRSQTRAVVRDSPTEARGVLEDLGYEVHWPGDEPEPTENTLRFTGR